MKINELVEIKNTKKMLKPEQLMEALKKELDVKEYMSIKDKRKLINDIVNGCILFEDNVFKFNEIDKYLNFTMKTIEAYTNLELSDDIENDYDMLCSNNLLGMVIDMFKKEYDDVGVLLKMQCDYLLNDNNIEVQVGKLFDSILSGVYNITDAIGDIVKDFDANKLLEGLDIKSLKQLVGKLK